MKPPHYNTKNRNNGVEVPEKNKIPEFSVPESKNTNIEEKKDALCFLKPAKIGKRTCRRHVSKITGSPKCLIDICAVFVVANESALKEMYKKKQVSAWRLINSNVFCGSKLSQCYDVVKDLNRKTKWLREIESENISTELFIEEYKNSNVFLQENHLLCKLKTDPFILSEQTEKTIDTLLADQ